VARKANEHEILEVAIAAFKRVTGWETEIQPHRNQKGVHRPGETIRRHTRLRITHRGHEVKLDVEIKPWLNTAAAGLLLLGDTGRKKHLVVTRHVQKAIADQIQRGGFNIWTPMAMPTSIPTAFRPCQGTANCTAANNH